MSFSFLSDPNFLHLLQSEAEENWTQDTTQTSKKRAQGNSKAVDQVTDVGHQGWELDAEERLKGDVNLGWESCQ